MLRSAAAQLLYQFSQPYKSLAAWAIAFSFLVSGLEVISAILVMPLIQILNGQVLETGGSSTFSTISRDWHIIARHDLEKHKSLFYRYSRQ
jgi:hypothetical protein